LRLFSSFIEQQRGAADFILLKKNAQYMKDTSFIKAFNCENAEQLRLAAALVPIWI
jgi:hypothetical protein